MYHITSFQRLPLGLAQRAQSPFQNLAQVQSQSFSQDLSQQTWTECRHGLLKNSEEKAGEVLCI